MKRNITEEKERRIMIVAAYAGVGKTTFCGKNPGNAIDVICMSFKYSNFYEVSKKIGIEESIKANEKLKIRKEWYLYYYWIIKYLISYCPEKYIVIPTIDIILNFLDSDRIPYTVVYPDASLKDEYEKRYRERGDSESFLSVFINQWDERIAELENRKSHRIVLESKQYLSDVLDCTKFKNSLEVYRNRQVLSFENSLKYENKQYEEMRKILHDGLLEKDWICGILYSNPICEDDIINDYVIVESKQQLKALLMKTDTVDNEYKFESYFSLLELIIEPGGPKYKATTYKCGDPKALTVLLQL